MSRIEPLDPESGPRRIVVDIWYPADLPASPARAAAAYLSVAAFEGVIGADGLRKQLGAAYEMVKAGAATTHAVVGAAFARSLRRSPVLLFSPGGGMIRELYTAQLEDLASHGYVVAALTHSYDGFLAVFPDGRSVAYDGRRWPKQPSLEGEANRNQLEWHAKDLRLVLDELSRATSGQPFAGRLDLKRVGAFGHSLGGMVAAHACQKDRRLRACLNQDGAVAMQPFYLDARGWGMDQAFLLMERAPRMEPPSDEELRAMRLTRVRAQELLKRLNANRDYALRVTGRGSYRVLLKRSATSHLDFSDLPILGARDRVERETREGVLAVIRAYTRTFFDEYLKGRNSPLLDGQSPGPGVEAVERFAPARRAHRGSEVRGDRDRLRPSQAVE